jgi:predicted ATPase
MEETPMPQILGFRVKNYRCLRDVTLGKHWDSPKVAPLEPMTVVIGKNGVGKSALFDAFGFLADCLKVGVEEACDARGRGGFEKIRSQGASDHIEFDVYYKQDEDASHIRYHLSINLDKDGRPEVKKEVLTQLQVGQNKPSIFLTLVEGTGFAWNVNTGYADAVKVTEEIKSLSKKIQSGRQFVAEENPSIDKVELSDTRKLGIATLGALKQHPRISDFRSFLEGWYISYFEPSAARSIPLAGPQKHLNIHGDNLGNVVQYMEREHKDRFEKVLEKIASKIPGVQTIKTAKSQDGRVLLQFNDRGFKDPFYAQQMSDGTLKLFAYLLMLEDPSPPPFICIEEPENGLYHKLLETLADEFRAHATGAKGGTQLFITTHQPYFVDALKPEEVWILEKGEDGFSTIRRASDDPIVKNMVDEGLPLGGLWYSDYLDARLK